MEQVRLLAAIGLSFLVLFVWSMFFTSNSKINKNEIPNHIEKNITEDIYDSNSKMSKYTQTQKFVHSEQTEGTDIPKEVTVDTPLFRVVLSEKGGRIKSTVLKKYKETSNPNSPLKEIIFEKSYGGDILAYISSNNPKKIQDAIFQSNSESDFLKVLKNNIIVSFSWNDGNGRLLVKSFEFRPDSYLINMKITVENISSDILKDNLILSLKDKKNQKAGYGFEGPSAFIDNHLKQFKNKEIVSNTSYTGHITWIGMESRYFMSSIIPSLDFTGRVEISMSDDIIENKIISNPFHLYPEDKIFFETSLFMGPKSIAVLSNIGHNMEKAIYFGLFDFIAKPCLWFMNKIYSFIPNYGVAIILLTFFSKLLLWPLGSKGYKSMSEMKKLQPLMAEVRIKYKTDKKKMNQEIMALYKTYKVNPMGGCLPMLLQIPVFFALYRMLYQAIELRHAPFMFWINDLAAPDRLFNFKFSIPFMQPPYGIPVLTIIMGATMLLQQKMSPPPGDPNQAKMMMFMPVIFTFIFINFSSGLVLYWLTNNILSISQQYYIQKKTI